jgi:hypothetical protein
MPAGQGSSIEHLLNGPSPAPAPTPTSAPPTTPAAAPAPTPAPTPGPAPTPPPAPPPPPPPAKWPTPAPPSSGGRGGGGGGGGGHVAYTESALKRFAQTSDARASAFGQALSQARSIQVSGDAFGIMFGRLVYSAYEKHVQSVTDGLQSAEDAMTSIADAMRGTADAVHSENQNIKNSLSQIHPGQ